MTNMQGNRPTTSPQCHSGSTALSKKIEYQTPVATVTALLESGAAVAAGADFYGLTALHKAAAWNRPDLLQIILQHLDDAADINATGGENGYTAAHHAVAMGAFDVLRVLASAPLWDSSARDASDMTAEDLSKSFGTHVHSAYSAAIVATATGGGGGGGGEHT